MEVWLIDLDRSAAALEALERETPRLASQDRSRARALGDAGDRRRRIAAYTALRILLERFAGPAIRGRPLVRGLTGKPRLAGSSVRFSLSHTANLALIGIATAHDIGVDIEAAREVRLSEHRRSEMIAAASGLAAKPLGGAASDDAFLQAWSRLEAYAKALGHGLARTLVDLGLRHRRPPTPLPEIEAAARRHTRQTGLSVRDVKLPHGLFGALAATQHMPPPRLRHFPAERHGLRKLAALPSAGRLRR